MAEHYKLVGHDTVPVDGLIEWATWFETADRSVARDEIGESCVSTVFLGLAHSFGQGGPILFETMVFGGPLDQETERYRTWDEAETGHAAMLARVQAAH